ncbi:GXWXG domain-containing protein [Streptomyces sp. NPDC021749]|uniref:GXWXG domain-containing protein n=1 Tax=Streptomyces sp. NPDC021749 TaxID=3154905 RepID=UPI0033E43C0D
MDIEQARARIAAVRAAGGRVTADELDRLWALLETVRPEEILGSWKGSAFLTGQREREREREREQEQEREREREREREQEQEREREES